MKINKLVGLVGGILPLCSVAGNAESISQQYPRSSVWTDVSGWERGRDVEDVASRLVGVMDSSNHAMRDRDFVDVRITQCRVRVVDAPGYLTENSVFLYVEQALSTALVRPYRQRFGRIAPGRSAETVTSSVYIPGVSPVSLIGFCAKPESERIVTMAELGASDCSVYLQRYGNLWAGSTPERGCPNDFNGAKWATSEVVLRKDGMVSWDRGWDDAGNHIWGASTGGYHFKKINPDKVDVIVNSAAARLSGRFDNSAQVGEDADFVPVRFNNCSVGVSGGDLSPQTRVLLVEQTTETPSGPLGRVRFYVFTPGDRQTAWVHASIRAPQAQNVVLDGFCARPEAERVVSVEILGAELCGMSFSPEGGVLVGRSPEGGCPSGFQGASWVDIEVSLKPAGIDSWERWYNAAGEQVAGSRKGPYRYDLQ